MSPSHACQPVASERLTLVALLALYACQALFVSLVVPPWQDADSPTHFKLVRILPWADRSEALTIPLETAVLESMARYRWWEPYEVPTPDPLPTTFADVAFGRGTYGQPLYYALGAGVLGITRPGDEEAAYWHLRLLSLCLSLAALAMGWAGTRLMFGPGVAIGATAVAVLYPQFQLAGIAVNPNVLAAVWGAFVWWQIGRVVANRRPELALVLIVLAALAAVFTKRSAIPFAVAALVAAAVLFRLHARHWGARRALLAVVAIVALLVLGGAVATMIEGGGLIEYWGNTVRMVAARRWELSDAWLYALASIDNTWFLAGWHRYVAPEPWQSVGRLITVIGIGGALLLLLRPSRERSAVAIAWLLVVAQIFVILAAGFWGFLVPHGRYAEPALAPMALLLWLGAHRILRPVAGRYTGAALVGALAVTDAGLLTALLMPAYLPW